MKGASAQRLGVLAVFIALAASAAMLLVMADYAYGPLLVSSRQEVTSAQVPDVTPTAPAATPLELSLFDRPRDVPEIRFKNAEERDLTLADFRGKVVLLNIWATWCVPCRKEMPALDALQARLGGDAFEVVAVNIDTRNLDKPKAWLQEVGITKLGYYADPSAKVFQDLKAIGKAFGMPTTLLVDPQGCELGALAGPAEWASDDAVKLIEAASGKI